MHQWHTQCISRAKAIIKRHNYGESSPEGLSKPSVTKMIIKTKCKQAKKHNKPIQQHKILKNKILK